MAGYKSTIKAQCLKQHTCLLCGAVYRYRIERSGQGQAPTPQGAQEKAAKAVQTMLETQYDQRACPHCGLLQPEMIGQSKRSTHGCMMLLSLGVAALAAILIGTYAFSFSTLIFIMAGIAAVISLIHAGKAVSNPNGNLQRNLNTAATEVSKGVSRLMQPGSAERPQSVPMSTSGLGLAMAFLLVGVLLIPAAEVKRVVSGWKANENWYPPVMGPGDSARFYFGQDIHSVKGYWDGKASAKATNAAELGLTPADLFKADTKHESWGGTIHVKSSEKNSSSAIFIDVTAPKNESLVGKTGNMDLQVVATYPSMYGGNSYSERDSKMVKTSAVTFAAPGASSQYWNLLWFGVVGGFVLQFVGGWMLYAKAKRLMNGLPVQLLPIEEPAPPPLPQAAAAK